MRAFAKASSWRKASPKAFVSASDAVSQERCFFQTFEDAEFGVFGLAMAMELALALPLAFNVESVPWCETRNVLMSTPPLGVNRTPALFFRTECSSKVRSSRASLRDAASCVASCFRCACSAVTWRSVLIPETRFAPMAFPSSSPFKPRYPTPTTRSERHPRRANAECRSRASRFRQLQLFGSKTRYYEVSRNQGEGKVGCTAGRPTPVLRRAQPRTAGPRITRHAVRRGDLGPGVRAFTSRLA